MSPLGDALPTQIAAYYAALDEGRLDDAVACFTEDVSYAVPRRGGSEVDPREQVTGRAALRAQLELLVARPGRHEILMCLSDGESCLLEGVLGDRFTDGSATFVASIQLDGAGLIDRYLAYMCRPAIEPAPRPANEGGAGTGALSALDHYFEALEAGSFAEAAGCFSEDVLYSHPPYRHTGIEEDRRFDFHGRGELLAGFEARGKSSFAHQITVCLQRGPHSMLEGVVVDLPGGGTGGFISGLTLDAGGRIERYISFYCEPGVPRR